VGIYLAIVYKSMGKIPDRPEWQLKNTRGSPS
jgi:hypothetical protein